MRTIIVLVGTIGIALLVFSSLNAIGGPECINKAVVFTFAEGNANSWKKFFEEDPKKSIHYIIDRAGLVVSSVPENEVANHAKGNNQSSIGIELVNRGNGVELYPESQMNALIKLLKEIRQRWKGIAVERVLGHEQVDSEFVPCGDKQMKRKQDPGGKFDWEKVRKGIIDAPL